MHYLRLTSAFARASTQSELAYRANLWVRILHSLLNLGTGVLGIVVLFEQVDSLRGWSLPATLALLGVYLTLAALRSLVIGPSLEALSGMDGEIWTGQFDYTLLRPVDVQFLASVRHWRPLALIDLALGLGTVGVALGMLGTSLRLTSLLSFVAACGTAIAILYAVLLALAAMVLWQPRFLFTWLFNAMFQMARYPVGLYPGWLRLVLTWVVPVGVMTTVPAQALVGELAPGMLIGSAGLASVLVAGATILFRLGLRRYASASS